MFTPNFTRNSGLFYSLFILGGMIFGEFSSCFAFFRAHLRRGLGWDRITQSIFLIDRSGRGLRSQL
jgi:hypothetical protein